MFKFLSAFVLLLLSSVSLQAQSVTSIDTNKGYYHLLNNSPQQQIWGLGFEIQSDAIGSGNKGLPQENISVPNNLTPAERERFYSEMLKGFRYCRIAGGLYLRGTTADQKELRGRWPSQMDELREMMQKAGIEGVSLEYWSPEPYWKANGKYTGSDGSVNKLKCFGPDFKNDPVYKNDTIAFLKDFARSLINDIKYLNKNGLKVKFWGLQNEPPVNTAYSCCVYTPNEYYLAFKTIAPYIKAYDPKIAIIADSWTAQTFLSKQIAADPVARQYVSAWVWHQIGANSNEVIKKQKEYLDNTYEKPVYQNEYEYLTGSASPKRCINIVQNMMNWFTFVNSPTWYWLHALKPATNSEASGYSLGFWRSETDEKTSSIEKGHWVYNPYNYNALAGFLKYMPWNSRRYAVSENKVRPDNRIFAYKTPEGKNVMVISNRCGADFTFQISINSKSTYKIIRYTPENAGPENKGTFVGTAAGPELSIKLPDMSWDFLVEQ
jgi:hypothetical protein